MNRGLYADLSGRTLDYRSVTDDTLDRLLSSMQAFAEKHAAEQTSKALNIVKQLSLNASTFNNPEQFNAAMSTANAAYNDVFDDETSKALLDGYKDVLLAEKNNFQADQFITNSINNTRQQISKLDELNYSDSIEDILQSLDKISSTFRQDASSNILKSLELLENDMQDIIYLTGLFDLKDENPNPEWDFEGINARLHLAAEAFKAGDYKRARTLTDQAELTEEKEHWRHHGSLYRNHLSDVNRKVAQIDGDFINDDNRQYGMFKYMDRFPTFGQQALTTLSLDEHTKKWEGLMTNIMNDPEIDWNKTTDGRDLKSAYTKDNGQMPAFLKELKAKVMKANGIKNAAQLNPVMVRRFLEESIDWVPTRFNVWSPKTDIEGQSEMGGQLFTEYLVTYQGLLNAHRDISTSQSDPTDDLPSFMYPRR